MLGLYQPLFLANSMALNTCYGVIVEELGEIEASLYAMNFVFLALNFLHTVSASILSSVIM